jgi:hypothetical protein
MPLPTTNLTLHLDASDTDRLFTTWVNDGPHTGTPADGNSVQAWMRETDGSLNPATAAYSTAGPVWRTGGSSPMLLPCLDFDGSTMEMRLCTDATTTSYKAASEIMGASAKTIVMALYVDAITATADFTEGPFGGGSHWGCFLKTVTGQPKLCFSAYDGAWATVAVNISTATTVVASLRHDGTNLYVSIDGGAESSAASGATADMTAEVRIGRCLDARSNCKIGEIAVYSAALTGTDKTDAIAYFRQKWQGVAGDGEEALAGSAITPGHGTQTPGISISI